MMTTLWRCPSRTEPFVIKMPREPRDYMFRRRLIDQSRKEGRPIPVD